MRIKDDAIMQNIAHITRRGGQYHIKKDTRLSVFYKKRRWQRGATALLATTGIFVLTRAEDKFILCRVQANIDKINFSSPKESIALGLQVKL